MARAKVRDRKRQTKISFSPAAKTPPAAKMGAVPSQPEIGTPTRATRATPAKSISKRAPKPTVVDSTSEDELAAETEQGMRLSMPATTKEHGMFGSSDVDAANSETSEDEQREEQQQVKAKLAPRKRRRAKDGSEPKEEDEDEKVIVVRTKRGRRRSPEIEDEEDVELRLPPSKRRRTTRQQSKNEGGESIVEVTPLKKRRQVVVVPQSMSEEETNAPRSRKGKVSRRQQSPEVPDETSPPRSKRRRLAKRPATPSENEEEEENDQEEEDQGVSDEVAGGSDNDDGEEQEDLQQDLAFLQSSPLPNRGKLRSAHEKPLNERQKALEALKKRRAGTNELSSSSTPGRSRRVVVVESESDSELEVIKEEPESESDLEGGSDSDESEEGDGEDGDEPEREANVLDMFQEDEEDEAFIDNDADAIIGEPILNPDDFMPLIISRLSSSKPKELFKYAIEWMVMKKIHPGFDSKSQVYDITFRKLDDEVTGLANSKFSSSAWTPDFTRALRARPDLMIMELTRGRKEVMDAHCEACNRRNHPASDELMFTGKPYNKETLEPLDSNADCDSNKDSDSDSDSESSDDSELDLNGEKPTYDAQGSRLPPENKTFTTGSTCKANAQVAHTLNHWRYHLYSWVKDYLAREGHLTAEKLVKRDGWTDKKREKAALKIVKGMEDVGEIRKLYHLYKDQMTYAADVRHDLNRGWRGQ